jgi:ketosteroid isomerase-like protein
MHPPNPSNPSNPALATDLPVQSLDRLVVFFETLTKKSVADLSLIYAPDARFKDPFNDVKGCAAIAAIFNHMFVALEAPRFVVIERISQGQQCFLTWEFRFRFKNYQPTTEQVILGASHIVFNAQGLVSLHRDYWDAAEELYEKLPVVGSVMRWLKRRANT